MAQNKFLTPHLLERVVQTGDADSTMKKKAANKGKGKGGGVLDDSAQSLV